MRKYNINAVSYKPSKIHTTMPKVQFTGDWFRTTVGIRQGCLLFLERIISDALHMNTTSVVSVFEVGSLLIFA